MKNIYGFVPYQSRTLIAKGYTWYIPGRGCNGGDARAPRGARLPRRRVAAHEQVAQEGSSPGRGGGGVVGG